MTSHTLRRAFCVVAAVSAFILSLGLVSTARAEAAVSVVLTRITQDASGVTVVGSVTQTGDPVDKVEVVLWRDGPVIATPTDLQSVLKTDTNTAFTALHSESEKYTLTTENIVSGGWTFTLQATWAGLGISTSGVYLAGVDVRLPGSDVSARPLARERTLLTQGGTTQGGTTEGAIVVEFSSTPSLLHGSVFMDDHLASEFTGRLGSLLALAQRENMSWAIDPLLHHEAAIMARGYEVLVDGQLVPGEGSKIAQDWLAKVDALPKNAGYRLPWANPDLGLAVGLSEEKINQALPFDALAALPLSVANLPLLVRARDGSGDSSWLDIVETLNPAVVLASATTSGTLSSGVLIASPASWGGLDGSESTSQLAAMREAEDSIYGPRLARIVDNPDQAEISNTGETVLLSDLIGAADRPIDAKSLTGPTNPILTSESVDAAADMGGAVALYTLLTRSESAVRELVASQRLAALSQNWKGDSASLAYTDTVAQWVGTLPEAVTLSATRGNVTLTSRTASFPVTITNKSPIAVYVRVVSASSSPLIMSVPSTELQMVNPGDSVTAILAPKVARDGDADVFSWLETSDGTRVSSPTTIHVSATQAAWLVWVIIAGAASLVVVGTVLRVRTVAKASRKGQS